MNILWRVLLVISMAMIGLVAGSFIGAQFFMAEGQGLAAASIALGYGLVGAVFLALVALIAGAKLPSIRVRNFALFSLLIAGVVYGGLTYRFMMKSAAEREPEVAFASVGNFTAIMERLDTSDPGLFVKMVVDSEKRTWTQTGPAPDNKICSAKMKANSLVNLRGALDILIAMSVRDIMACRTAQGPAIKRLEWDVEGIQDKLDVSVDCVQNHPPIARTLALIESATHRSSSKVKCK